MQPRVTRLALARSAGTVGLASMFLLLAGCGPGTGEVSGKVTYKGTALPGGLLTFRPANPKANAVTVELEQDGSYPKVTLPTGEVSVLIDNRELGPPMQMPSGTLNLPLPPEVKAKMAANNAEVKKEGAGKKASDRYRLIPEKYHMVETSGLQFTMKAGTQTQNFELTD